MRAMFDKNIEDKKKEIEELNKELKQNTDVMFKRLYCIFFLSFYN
jgi:hypothetical protein